MISSEKIFEIIFYKVTEPFLTDLDFVKVNLPKGWMQPTFLYKHKKENVWFGCSWDWRDFYFDADLGELFCIKDVMPRVIVIGNNLDLTVKDTNLENLLTFKFEHVNQHIEQLVSHDFAKYYDSSEVRNKRVNKLRDLIIKQVGSLDDLAFEIRES